MNAEQMSRAIADALQHEAQTYHLANELHQLARTRGLRPKPQEVAGTIEFLRQYVAHVPAILQEAERAAQAAGLRGEMAALIATVEQYWFESDDFFPDHQGLGGLVDDAYVALSVIQGASARFRQRTGRPLIDLD